MTALRSPGSQGEGAVRASRARTTFAPARHEGGWGAGGGAVDPIYSLTLRCEPQASLEGSEGGRCACFEARLCRAPQHEGRGL